MRVTNNDKAYECKTYPYSGWCTHYEPGATSLPWSDAWSKVAECVHMVYSVSHSSPAAWSVEPCGCEPTTRRPTPGPTPRPQPNYHPDSQLPCTTNCCAPLFTAGHDYSLFEQISFENYNYVCYVPEKCRQAKYAPFISSLLAVWWRIDANPCNGKATRMPTPQPTQEPTSSEVNLCSCY